MHKFLLVVLGGAFGTGLRYSLSTFLSPTTRQAEFPLATFIVNVSGSFLIGFLGAAFDSRLPVSPETRAAALAGVLGGYTTFSTFSSETVSLIQGGRLWLAALYASASVLLGLAAVWAGVRMAQMF